jgi:hypothetical protein
VQNITNPSSAHASNYAHIDVIGFKKCMRKSRLTPFCPSRFVPCSICCILCLHLHSWKKLDYLDRYEFWETLNKIPRIWWLAPSVFIKPHHFAFPALFCEILIHRPTSELFHPIHPACFWNILTKLISSSIWLRPSPPTQLIHLSSPLSCCFTNPVHNLLGSRLCSHGLDCLATRLTFVSDPRT